jgi:hypothetical protein
MMNRGQTTSFIYLPDFLAGFRFLRDMDKRDQVQFGTPKSADQRNFHSGFRYFCPSRRFIVASPSAGTPLRRTMQLARLMSQSGHQIMASAAPSLTPAGTPAMLEP